MKRQLIEMTPEQMQAHERGQRPHHAPLRDALNPDIESWHLPHFHPEAAHAASEITNDEPGVSPSWLAMTWGEIAALTIPVWPVLLVAVPALVALYGSEIAAFVRGLS